MARSPSVRVVDRRLQPGEVWASKAGTGLGASVGTHFTLLWVLAGFVVLTAIICMYAGEQRHLAERQFGDVRVHEDLKVDGTVLGKQKIVALTTTKTVTESESGTLFTLDSAAGAYTITLPTVTAGNTCRFTFVVKENTPTAAITISSNAANISGNLSIQSDAAEDNRVACAGVTSVLVATAALTGDRLEFVGDGTNYYGTGFGQVQGAFTTAA